MLGVFVFGCIMHFEYIAIFGLKMDIFYSEGRIEERGEKRKQTGAELCQAQVGLPA